MCVDATIWPYAACIACVHLCYDCITDCQLALVAQVRKAQSCFIPPPNPHTNPKQLAHKHTTACQLQESSSSNQSTDEKSSSFEMLAVAGNYCMPLECTPLSLLNTTSLL